MALTDKNIPQCYDEGQASEPDFGDKALMRANIGEKVEKNLKCYTSVWYTVQTYFEVYESSFYAKLVLFME